MSMYDKVMKWNKRHPKGTKQNLSFDVGIDYESPTEAERKEATNNSLDEILKEQSEYPIYISSLQIHGYYYLTDEQNLFAKKIESKAELINFMQKNTAYSKAV